MMKSVIIVLCLMFITDITVGYNEKLPCHVDDYVYQHRDEYVNTKLKCQFYRCNNGTWVVGYRACVFNGRCYNAGKDWTYGCHKLTCLEEKPSNTTKIYRTKITSPACSFEGQCKKRGSSWKQNCINYKCHFNVTETKDGPIYEEQIIADAGCKWGKRCFKIGEKYTEDCQTYKCYVDYKDEYSFHRGMRLYERGCYSFRKKKTCVANGDIERIDCSNYKCSPSGNFMFLTLETYGCKLSNGTCVYEHHKENNTQCSQRSCTDKGWKTDLYACSYKDTCIPVGDTFVDDDTCANSTCTLKVKGRGKKKRKLLQMKITSIGCPEKDGSCRKADEKWTDKNCAERKCIAKLYGNGKAKSKTKIQSVSCKDTDGKCHPIGSKGFKSLMDGTVFNNCRCVKKGRYGVTVSCEMYKETFHTT